MYCKYCGHEHNPRFYLPSKCKRCKHAFDWGPSWVPNVILLVSILPPPILGGLLSRFGLGFTVLGFALGFALTFVIFNLLEVAAYRAGLLRSDLASEEPVEMRDHIKKPLSELDFGTRARVELSRVKMPNIGNKQRDGEASPKVETVQPRPHAAPTPSAEVTPTRKRCRFEHVRAGQTDKIDDLSRLASAIVREHFDPIIGTEQNDYMIALFQSPEAIARQIDEGYEYSFVCPPGTTGKEPPEKRRIGFVAFVRREPDDLYLSKFYLRADQRGKGYSHDMMEFVRREAARLGCSRITLNVNRNNYQAILAYEHLGFSRTGEERRDIGGGFVMDDLVYSMSLDAPDLE